MEAKTSRRREGFLGRVGMGQGVSLERFSEREVSEGPKEESRDNKNEEEDE